MGCLPSSLWHVWFVVGGKGACVPAPVQPVLTGPMRVCAASQGFVLPTDGNARVLLSWMQPSIGPYLVIPPNYEGATVRAPAAPPLL